MGCISQAGYLLTGESPFETKQVDACTLNLLLGLRDLRRIRLGHPDWVELNGEIHRKCGDCGCTYSTSSPRSNMARSVKEAVESTARGRGMSPLVRSTVAIRAHRSPTLYQRPFSCVDETRVRDPISLGGVRDE